MTALGMQGVNANGSNGLLSPQQLASLQQQIGLASQAGELSLGSHGDNTAATGSIQVSQSFMQQLTMRFGSTAKVLAKCKLNCYKISECSFAAGPPLYMHTGLLTPSPFILSSPGVLGSLHFPTLACANVRISSVMILAFANMHTCNSLA